MRFDRHPRFEGITWTERKRLAAERKPQRDRKRLEKAYPLFADQLPVATALPEADEIDLRTRQAHKSEQAMRDLDAKHWRKGRSLYFACSPAMRAAIQAEWRAWRGPANARCFIYIVEKHNGDAEARSALCAARDAELRSKVLREIEQATPLPLF